MDWIRSLRRPAIAALVDKLSAHPASPLITMGGIGLLLRLGGTFNYTLGFSLVSLLMALFMLQLICLHRSRWWSWLDNRVLIYLGGALSYSMYLYHEWRLGAARQLAPGSVALQVILAFPVTIALAAGSYHLVEKPFLWIRDRRLNRKKGLSRAVPAAAWRDGRFMSHLVTVSGNPNTRNQRPEDGADAGRVSSFVFRTQRGPRARSLWAPWVLDGLSWAIASAHDVPECPLGEPIDSSFLGLVSRGLRGLSPRVVARV